jgi:hypothetical protein
MPNPTNLNASAALGYQGSNALREQTWFACTIAIISVVPGFIIGAFAAIVYRALAESFYGPFDPFALNWLFGISFFSTIGGFFFSSLFPWTVHGVVTGLIAMWVTQRACPKADLKVAAYVTGAAYTGVMITLGMLVFLVAGLSNDLPHAACQVLGLWMALHAFLKER